LPPFAVFKKSDFRYSVLAHEITHWTGAATRLNRNLAPRFQKEAYAAEELIAELGSAFVCAELELAIEPRRDHAPYIQSWLNVLRNDRRAIFTAATKAQQAVDWLFHRDLKIQEAAA
jgi:antirestriction protein ArdC